MATSESKGQFLQNESIRITNRIGSNRELECSSWRTARERSLFTMSEHNKYIYKLDSDRLPERNNHHSWPPIIGHLGLTREIIRCWNCWLLVVDIEDVIISSSLSLSQITNTHNTIYKLLTLETLLRLVICSQNWNRTHSFSGHFWLIIFALSSVFSTIQFIYTEFSNLAFWIIVWQ